MNIRLFVSQLLFLTNLKDLAYNQDFLTLADITSTESVMLEIN